MSTTTNTALLDIKAQIQAELAALAGTVPAPSGMTISLKGKVFTLPNGQSSQGPMQAIVLDARNVRTYYKGQYNPNALETPPCFAIAKQIEDLRPSPNAKQPMAESCSECKYDQWGSATNGSKGKACKNAIRLAVVPANFTPETQPMILTVSPTGIKSYSSLVNDLKSSGLIPAQIVTEIAFDPHQTYPTLVFRALHAHDQVEAVWRLRDKAQSALDREPSGS
jgi:hypothetical protein